MYEGVQDCLLNTFKKDPKDSPCLHQFELLCKEELAKCQFCKA